LASAVDPIAIVPDAGDAYGISGDVGGAELIAAYAFVVLEPNAARTGWIIWSAASA
jgi:hypothetical protein